MPAWKSSLPILKLLRNRKNITLKVAAAFAAHAGRRLELQLSSHWQIYNTNTLNQTARLICRAECKKCTPPAARRAVWC